MRSAKSVGSVGEWSGKVISTAIVATLILLGHAVVPQSAPAQQTGRVAGTITDASTGRALDGVQVVVAGTGLGTLTNQDGRYEIREVPTGQQEVQAQLIGYGQSSQTVTIEAGQSVTVDFSLEESALEMEQIVVTGQAGPTRQKEVGNVVERLDFEELAEPTASTEDLLQGRATGLLITGTSASAGAGSDIRLRGNTSVSLGTDPLIYIDGVRVRSAGYPKNVPPVGYSGRSANVTPSILNDINPSDISRVEIVKGAAATTLYGSEASAGVIQIFTKSGESGANWSAEIRGDIDNTLPYGSEEHPLIYMEPWLRNSTGIFGYVSTRGSLAQRQMSYFLSGSYSRDREVMPEDMQEKFSIRGNFQWEGFENVNIQWNTSYTQRHINQTPSGDNAQGLTLNVWRQGTNYVGSTAKASIDSILQYDIRNHLSHLVSGVTLNHSPSDRFSQKVTVGYDRQFTEGRNIRRRGFLLSPQGKLAVQNWTAQTLTVDYVGTLNFDFGENFTNTLSVGGEVITEDVFSTKAYGEGFPAPGDITVSNAGLTLAFEDRREVITAGVFAQERFGISDRFFLTLGVRADGNTAFGEQVELEIYPKASGAYSISEEDFWPEGLGQMKIRAAYGESGRAPGTFDAVRTWTATRFGNESGFLPRNQGSPELSAERAKEFEVGFNSALFNGRLVTDFTWYNTRTTDALFPVRVPPSTGDWNAQLENVGTIRNRGIELNVTGQVIDRQEWALQLGSLLTTNYSETLDLGEASEFGVGGAGWIVEGQPVPVVRGPFVTNPDEFAAPEYELRHNYGAAQPTVTVTPNFRIRFPGDIILRGRVEYRAGHWIHDSNTFGKIIRGQLNWPICMDEGQAFQEGRVEDLTAFQRARCISTDARNDANVNRGDFFKFRNASLQLPLPEALLPGPVQNGTFTLSASNFAEWQAYDFLDPEIGSNIGDESFTRSQQEHVPPPATYTAAIRVNF